MRNTKNEVTDASLASSCGHCDLARNNECSRRTFLQQAAGAAAALSLPLLTPGSAYAAGGNAVRAGFTTLLPNSATGNTTFSTGVAVPVGFVMKWFGARFAGVFVNQMGNVTLDAANPTMPNNINFNNSDRKIIAPFYGNVDTRTLGTIFWGRGVLCGRPAFGVYWNNVGNFDAGTTSNDFQLILIQRTDTGAGNFDIEFNYNGISWDNTTANDRAAGVGFSNLGTPFFQLPGSFQTPTGFINGSGVGWGNPMSGPELTANRLLATTPGRYHFLVRNGTVFVPTPNVAVNVEITQKVRVFYPVRWVFNPRLGGFQGNFTITRLNVPTGIALTECLDEQAPIPPNTVLGPPLTLVLPPMPQTMAVVNRSGFTGLGRAYVTYRTSIPIGGLTRIPVIVSNPLRVNLGTFFLNSPPRLFAGLFNGALI